LVDAGSNVNERDTHGYTPLIIAAKKNQTEAIKYLLLHGADPKVTNEDEEDALHFAHLRENLEAIKLLE
jgi:ankyrin repeat protein